MTDMLDIDRVSMGWKPWLTPRQTRVIAAKLHDRDIEPGDEEELEKMRESFGHEAALHRQKQEKSFSDLSENEKKEA